jgi:hypothetical protein
LIGTSDTTNTIDRWIDGAWHAIAAFAVEFDTKFGSNFDEIAIGVYRVPSKLGECVSMGVGVCTCNVRRPVSNGLGSITPSTGICNADSRRVNVETSYGLVWNAQ